MLITNCFVLVNHVRCSLCNMTCPTKSALEHHLHFRHSDEKPYPCNMCENRFEQFLLCVNKRGLTDIIEFEALRNFSKNYHYFTICSQFYQMCQFYWSFVGRTPQFVKSSQSRYNFRTGLVFKYTGWECKRLSTKRDSCHFSVSRICFCYVFLAAFIIV